MEPVLSVLKACEFVFGVCFYEMKECAVLMVLTVLTLIRWLEIHCANIDDLMQDLTRYYI